MYSELENIFNFRQEIRIDDSVKEYKVFSGIHYTLDIFVCIQTNILT